MNRIGTLLVQACAAIAGAIFSASIIDRLSQISTTRLGAAFSSRRKLQRNRGKPKMPQRPLNQVLAMPASLASSQSTEACSFLKAKSATSGRGNLGLSRPRSLARIAGARASALCFAPASPSPARERITSSLSRASATARPALFQRLIFLQRTLGSDD